MCACRVLLFHLLISYIIIIYPGFHNLLLILKSDNHNRPLSITNHLVVLVKEVKWDVTFHEGKHLNWDPAAVFFVVVVVVVVVIVVGLCTNIIPRAVHLCE